MHNGILFSHKKDKLMPFAATWTELEILILSEVRQKGKDKHHMISLICIIQNMAQMILSTNGNRSQPRRADLWFSVEDGGREWDGQAVWGLGMQTYIWNGWAMGPYCAAQGTVCDGVALLYHRN